MCWGGTGDKRDWALAWGAWHGSGAGVGMEATEGGLPPGGGRVLRQLNQRGFSLVSEVTDLTLEALTSLS